MEPGPCGPATWSLFPPGPAWQGAVVGRKRGAGAWRTWSGQHPGPVTAAQAAAGEVAQVEGGGADLEPGVVLGHPGVAEFEPPPAAGGDLGDHPLDVGPVLLVFLAQGGLGSPGGPQDRVAGVQVQAAPASGGGAPAAQRAGAAGGAEGDVAPGADEPGQAGRAGHGAGVLIDGEV